MSNWINSLFPSSLSAQAQGYSDMANQQQIVAHGSTLQMQQAQQQAHQQHITLSHSKGFQWDPPSLPVISPELESKLMETIEFLKKMPNDLFASLSKDIKYLKLTKSFSNLHPSYLVKAGEKITIPITGPYQLVPVYSGQMLSFNNSSYPGISGINGSSYMQLVEGDIYTAPYDGTLQYLGS